jgi:adenylate cyclase
MERRLRRLWNLTRRHLGGIGAAVLTVGLVYTGSIEWMEYRSFDKHFELRPERPPRAPIVIISIDDASVVELNEQWPFPRRMHADLIDRISAWKPLVIGVDVLFPDPSSRGKKDDEALGAAIARAGNVVLATACTEDVRALPDVQAEGRTPGLKVTLADCNMPVSTVGRGAAAAAAVNLHQDADSHVRRVPLRVRVGDTMESSFDATIHRLAAATGLPAKPLPETEKVLINFRGGRGTFPSIPYYRIANGEISAETAPGELTGKIVLVGSTTDLEHDVFPTVFTRGMGMPGVEIHAHALETLIRGDPIREVPRAASSALAVLGALVGSALVVRFRAPRALAITALMWVAVAALGFAGFALFDVWLRGVAFTVGLILGYGSTATENLIRTQRERRRMSLFFSQEVVRTLMRERDEGRLTSSRRVVTVLFSDIRDFTSLSEKLAPEQVNEMVLDYLTEMTEIVEKNGGVVDKYIGDCVMALYNAPLPNPDHAANAVRTGLELQERVLNVSAKWHAKIGVPIRCGVGINTGEAVVGFLGSRKRPAYTAIGDAVNLAARLEPLTKDHGAAIIISEYTHELVRGRFPTRPLGEVTVKGKLLPVKIYGVVPTSVRKHTRVALDAAAMLTTIGDGQSCRVRTADISEGGLALTGLPPDWDVGRKLQIRLDGGGLSRPVIAEGTIVSRRGAAAGVQFTTVEEDSKPAIADCVARGRETGLDDDQ